MSERDGDELRPAERRLLSLLELLRDARAERGPAPEAIVRVARVQLALREAAETVARLAAAVVDGLVLVGSRGRRRT